MRIDITIQIVVAQLWLICHVICYPGYNRGTKPVRQKGHLLSTRALSHSFMPGFGKRQGMPLDNSAAIMLRPSAYGNYPVELEELENIGAPYSMLDVERNRDRVLDEALGDGFGIDKADLRAMVVNYLRNAENEAGTNVDDQILPGGWRGTEDNDRTSKLLQKFKMLQQSLDSQ